MTPLLDQLRAKAKAATPGSWRHVIHGYDDLVEFGPGNYSDDITPANAEYIASANPETILKLLDALDMMGEALVYVHGQPFNGSWDAQAVYLNGVFHRVKEVLK